MVEQYHVGEDTNKTITKIHVVWGCGGWGGTQVLAEIARGGWGLCELNGECFLKK